MNEMQAKAAVAEARKNNCRLIEAFHYRYHPTFQTLLDWIADGKIGEVTEITGYFSAPIPNTDGCDIRHSPQTGGGSFMDLGCYPLHWARTVLNSEPLDIEAHASLTDLGIDETMTVRMRFAKGVRVTLRSSMGLEEPCQSALTIQGTLGRLEYQNPLEPQRGRLTLSMPSAVIEAEVSSISTYTYQLDSVLTALRCGAILPTEGNENIDQQRTLDRVYDVAGLKGLRFHAL